MAVDISKLDLSELDRLSTRIEKRKAEVADLQRKQLAAKWKKEASALGLTVQQVLRGSTAPRGKSRQAKVKYRHPKNPSLGWAGRGRKPNWLVAELKGGKKLEDFRV